VADVSVRPALPADSERIGAIHAETLRLAAEAGLGRDLPDEAADGLGPAAFAAQWRAAIDAPPTPLHRVLTALDGQVIVGFAALAPADGDLPHAGAALQAEIVALEVAPDRVRAGHGSRLLAACAEILRQQDAVAVLTWCVQGDQARTRFLTSAGFAPLGVRRRFAVGDGEITQIAWHTTLG